MAKKKTDGPKIELEREYNVPLRKGWLKVPKYKRGAKAVKTLKEFLVRHMKVYDRDLRKIKLDIRKRERRKNLQRLKRRLKQKLRKETKLKRQQKKKKKRNLRMIKKKKKHQGTKA